MFLWNPLESSQNFLRLLNQSFQVSLPSFFHLLLLPQCSLFCCLLQVASSLEHITTAEGRSGEFVHQKLSLLQLKTVSWHRTVTYPAFCTVKLPTVKGRHRHRLHRKKKQMMFAKPWQLEEFWPSVSSHHAVQLCNSSSSCCISISLRCSSSSSWLSDDLRHARVPVITMRYILCLGKK